MRGTDTDWAWAKEIVHLVNKLPLGDGEKWKTLRMAVCDAFRSLPPQQTIDRLMPRGKYREGLIYLAVPYTHPDPAVREQRFEAANLAAAVLMTDGHLVFSPISHTHLMVIKYRLPVGFGFYQRWSRLFLSMSSRLIVLRVDGWQQSVGVKAEITFMKTAGKPVEYLDPLKPKEFSSERNTVATDQKT